MVYSILLENNTSKNEGQKILSIQVQITTMAKTKTRIYSHSENRTMEAMVEVTKTTFEDLGMAVKTQYLDRALIECAGKSPAGSPLGNNSATIYKEEDKIYLKLKYEMPDQNTFWDTFETNLQIYGASAEEIEEKAIIINQICDAIRDMGGDLDEELAWDFLYNFERNFQRLPRQEEIDQIADSYLQTGLSEHRISEDDKMFVEEEEQEKVQEEDERITVTPEEALKQIVRDMPHLADWQRREYIQYLDTLLFRDQKGLVAKIKQIEEDIDKVPYLTKDEREELHTEVRTYDAKKRRRVLLGEIKKRKKNEIYYKNRLVQENAIQEIKDFKFLEPTEMQSYIEYVQTLPADRKGSIPKIINEVNMQLENLEEQGIMFTSQDKQEYRQELVKMQPEERQKRIEGIVAEEKADMIQEEIIEAIPQLAFEDNSKLIKEMIWMDKAQRTQRLNEVKEELGEAKEEKADVFAGSSAGKVCQECSWPMGKWSTKCPRCGFSETAWLDDI